MVPSLRKHGFCRGWFTIYWRPFGPWMDVFFRNRWDDENPCWTPFILSPIHHMKSLNHPIVYIYIPLDPILIYVWSHSPPWRLVDDVFIAGWLKPYTGWWLTYPSEKYESVGMMTFPIYEKVKNVPNHQPAINNGMFYHLSTGAGFRVAIHRTND